jgi:hypothetical protein
VELDQWMAEALAAAGKVPVGERRALYIGSLYEPAAARETRMQYAGALSHVDVADESFDKTVRARTARVAAPWSSPVTAPGLSLCP